MIWREAQGRFVSTFEDDVQSKALPSADIERSIVHLSDDQEKQFVESYYDGRICGLLCGRTNLRTAVQQKIQLSLYFSR